jgi:hypothetical protein
MFIDTPFEKGDWGRRVPKYFLIPLTAPLNPLKGTLKTKAFRFSPLQGVGGAVKTDFETFLEVWAQLRSKFQNIFCSINKHLPQVYFQLRK